MITVITEQNVNQVVYMHQQIQNLVKTDVWIYGWDLEPSGRGNSEGEKMGEGVSDSTMYIYVNKNALRRIVMPDVNKITSSSTFNQSVNDTVLTWWTP